MSPEDQAFIDKIEQRLAKAVAEENFEAATRLRDQLRRLREGGGSNLRVQVPGRMGLGTSTEDYGRPEGWTPPKRPEPLTAGHKPGGRRRR